ncbi:SPB4 [Ecytonucleospora hepatopenaei]|uniref:ATP-dependent RNA helicase n=1 Tax=Ecytonucleospora hepatopenaei TaxID=646526 RepID=A0A1W0E6X8_9MICR|nr:SPB4 [Ecytonucleospora hepatopenaei]
MSSNNIFSNNNIIHNDIKSILHDNNYINMTDIQYNTLNDKSHYMGDRLIHAPTGSGKTLCYVIPIINYIYNSNICNNSKICNNSNIYNSNICNNSNTNIYNNNTNICNIYNYTAIIIIPTRELAIQINNIFNMFNINTTILIGGNNTNTNICNTNIYTNTNIYNNTNILISTPGKLLSIINNNTNIYNNICNNINNNICNYTKYIIFDEADKLLSNDFYSSYVTITNKIYNKHSIIQYYSATINDDIIHKINITIKKNIDIIHNNILNNDNILNNNSNNDNTLNNDNNSNILNYNNILPNNLIINYIYINNAIDKLYIVNDIINKYNKVIIFYNTCAEVEYFYNYYNNNSNILNILYNDNNSNILNISNNDNNNLFLHGKLDQSIRSNTYNTLMHSDSYTLHATDVCARGYDFKGVDAVVHFDVAKEPATLIHRSGRTGRNGAGGISIILLMKNEHAYVKYMNIAYDKIEMVNKTEEYYSNINNSNININLYNSNISNNTNICNINKINNSNVCNINKINNSKAFVSYIRSYKEHILNYILNYKELDMNDIIQLYNLKHIPPMVDYSKSKGRFKKESSNIKNRKNNSRNNTYKNKKNKK